MFDFLFRKKLKKICIAIVDNSMPKLKLEMTDALKNLESMSDSEIEEDNSAEQVISTNMNFCKSQLFNYASDFSPRAAAMLPLMMLHSPFDDMFDSTKPMHIGMWYMFVYYAITGKEPKSYECIELNHYHAAAIQAVAKDIASVLQ